MATSRIPNNRRASPGPCSEGALHCRRGKPRSPPTATGRVAASSQCAASPRQGYHSRRPQGYRTAWAKKRGRERHVLENSAFRTALYRALRQVPRRDTQLKERDSRQNARSKRNTADHLAAGILPTGAPMNRSAGKSYGALELGGDSCREDQRRREDDGARRTGDDHPHDGQVTPEKAAFAQTRDRPQRRRECSHQHRPAPALCTRGRRRRTRDAGLGSRKITLPHGDRQGQERSDTD